MEETEAACLAAISAEYTRMKVRGEINLAYALKRDLNSSYGNGSVTFRILKERWVPILIKMWVS